MTKAQMEKLREIAEMVDQHGIDELIEKLKYECLKAAYVYQYLDENPGTRRSIGKIYEDFERIMKDERKKNEAVISSDKEE
jgi:hypothetical protein